MRSKTVFICLLLIFIFLAAIIVNLTYQLTKTEKSEIRVSGVLIEADDYSDLLLVEIAKQAIPEENKTIDVSQTAEEPEQSENLNTTSAQSYNTASSNGNPYYIKVNYTANTVTIYGLDSNGIYSIPIKAMICSSGKATPRSGVYKTPAKYRWALLNGNVWGQYSTRITGSILFHSVPYSSQSVSSLKANYYDKLGLAVSAGCIRLTVADAKWIYDNCPTGTLVEFYGSSDPGPLGKPTSMKISSYPSYLSCWDPTDPDPNNPWIEYFNSQNNQTDPEPTSDSETTSDSESTSESTPTTTPTSESQSELTPETTNMIENNVTNDNTNTDGTNNTVNNTVNNINE